MEVKRSLIGPSGLNFFGRAARHAETKQARELQARFLPSDIPQVDGYGIACAWHPSDEVSGDYFDVFPLDDKRMALCVADVSGKGLSAATLMGDLHAAVRAHACEAETPADLCTRVNKALCARIAPGKFVTMFYGVLDRATGRLQYESAGHCLPVLIRHGGQVEFPTSFGGVLGLFSHWLYRDQEAHLLPGDTLLLITDGVIEAEGHRREEFGYQRLISVAQTARTQGAEALGRQVLEAIAKFSNGTVRDDASLIVINVDHAAST